jgi:hypothetical protein
MVESGYSYEGLPDPASYYPETNSDIFIIDQQQQQLQQQHQQQQVQPQQSLEGLQTPSTRAKRVVHEVIV